jgi:hypothetical protein
MRTNGREAAQVRRRPTQGSDDAVEVAVFQRMIAVTCVSVVPVRGDLTRAPTTRWRCICIDEYRLYLRPIVLGRGVPFFAGPRPPLRLVASDRIGEDTIRLTYVPA